MSKLDIQAVRPPPTPASPPDARFVVGTRLGPVDIVPALEPDLRDATIADLLAQVATLEAELASLRADPAAARPRKKPGPAIVRDDKQAAQHRERQARYAAKKKAPPPTDAHVAVGPTRLSDGEIQTKTSLNAAKKKEPTNASR